MANKGAILSLPLLVNGARVPIKGLKGPGFNFRTGSDNPNFVWKKKKKKKWKKKQNNLKNKRWKKKNKCKKSWKEKKKKNGKGRSG
jgi:hypothetical protein